MRQGDAPTEKKQMTFLLPVALMERLRRVATLHHRSLVGELLVAVEEYLTEQEKGQKHG
jgi:hypothetical protein